MPLAEDRGRLDVVRADIARLESRREQINAERAEAVAKAEQLSKDLAAARVEGDRDAIKRLHPALTAAHDDRTSCDFAMPEITRGIGDLRLQERDLARQVAEQEANEAQERYVAALGEADAATMTILREQLAPIYRELSELRNAVTRTERTAHSSAGRNLPAEPEWSRAATQAHPGAAWRIQTIQEIAQTGQPASSAPSPAPRGETPNPARAETSARSCACK
jgi:chromosome segregation ATPase